MLPELSWCSHRVVSESLVYFPMCRLWPPNQSVSRKILVLHLPDELLEWVRASQGRLEGTGVHSL